MMGPVMNNGVLHSADIAYRVMMSDLGSRLSESVPLPQSSTEQPAFIVELNKQLSDASMGDVTQQRQQETIETAGEESRMGQLLEKQSVFFDTRHVVNAERVKAMIEKYMKNDNDSLAVVKAFQEVNAFAEPPLPYSKVQMLASYVRACQFGGTGYGPDMMLESA